jgi:hypothetical protein
MVEIDRRFRDTASIIRAVCFNSPHISSPEYYTNYEVVNKSFQNAEEFKYLGTTVTNQNYNHEEAKNRLNSENA